MLAKDELSDDYVADLLAKDAKSITAKYSRYGLQELLPKRATSNAPKPNTRFLKNIIRETDNHNTALRAKELAESRARLRRLREGEGIGASSSSTNGYGRLSPEDDHRAKRRRVKSDDEADRDQRRGYGKSQSRRDKETHSQGHRHHHRHRDHRYDSDDAEDERSRPHERRRHHHRSDRRQIRGKEREESSTKHQQWPRSRHRTRSHSPGPDKDRRSHRHRSLPRGYTPSTTKHSGARESPETRAKEHNHLLTPAEDNSDNGKKRSPSPANDSDPLEFIIGPPPPPPAPRVKGRGRGRGAFASTSAMDSHFSSSYDPSIDVQLDLDDVDDWGMALEALRDRQRWQKQGAERLKSAGFTEEEVQKWEKGGEKTQEDVVWKGIGEGREWDRGKVVGEDGVETKPEWGRLKGT